jgi:hypothetical protein
MTPKEEAKELYNKMYGETPIRAIISEIEKDKQCAKQCALIAVETVILNCYEEEEYYWQEVKQEIEKL